MIKISMGEVRNRTNIVEMITWCREQTQDIRPENKGNREVKVMRQRFMVD